MAKKKQEVVEKSINTMKIISCTCKGTPAADYQDRVYGKGRRAANIPFKGDPKCTVCGARRVS